ncbi:MAG: Cna B-type domain-containing protein [Actinomycetaceae bacterium]|nr:Cna B-type domain-containing protein [Actinomycetaceae bacterium]
MEKKLRHGRKRGFVFTVLTAFAVLLGLFVPALAPVMPAQADPKDPDPVVVEAESATVTVTKTFSGLVGKDFPADFAISLKNNETGENVVEGVEPTVSQEQGKTIWQWKLDLPKGEYKVSESNQVVEDYDLTSSMTVTTNGNPTSVAFGETFNVEPRKAVIADVTRETENSHTDWPVDLTDEANTFFAANLTQNAGTVVITAKELPQFEKDAVTQVLKGENGPFPNKTIEFLNVAQHAVDVEDSDKKLITFKHANLTYDPDLKEIVIEEKSQWTQVVSMRLTPKAGTTKIDVVNSYKQVEPVQPVETIKIPVKKVWVDEGNEDKRPPEISVNLNANGVSINEVFLSPGDDWSGVFEFMPQTQGDDEVKYEVVEKAVPEGYEVSYGGNAETGFTITNTFIAPPVVPETVNVEGAKTWVDNNDKAGKRPESITINLLADGKEVAEAKVTAKDNWKWSFADQPKLDDAGKEIVYTITEDPVKGYTAKVDGYNVTNTVVPEKPVLAKTGVSTNVFTGLAAALLGAGGLLVALRRRHS